MIKFIKMHGLGNDFVIIDGRGDLPSLTSDQIRHIADRRRGVGCDQLIMLEPPKQPETDLFMRIYNPDGSESGACGNATRCVADIIMAEKGADAAVIQTAPGLLYCTRADGGLVTVDMGAPRLEWHEIPLAKQCDTLHLPLDGDPVGVNMGNPHCVFFVGDAKSVNVADSGKTVENDPLFPERANVEYAHIVAADHIRMRVWERGAGITQACGTGACAVAVAAIRRGLVEGRDVRVTLDGGDLHIHWRENDGHVLMTGPVAYVFEGTISLE